MTAPSVNTNDWMLPQTLTSPSSSTPASTDPNRPVSGNASGMTDLFNNSWDDPFGINNTGGMNTNGGYSPGSPVTTAGTPATTGTAPATTSAPGTGAAAAPPATPAATTGTAGAAGSSSLPDWMNEFLNGLTGGKSWGAELGGMAPFLADYYLAQKQADRAQAANQKTIQPLYDQATKWLDAAGKELNLYETGTITPGQQAMIDKTSAEEKARILQGAADQGFTDSGVINGQMRAIDQSNTIMKQGFIDDSLKKALQMDQEGGTYLMQAIQLKLTSDTQISQTMMQLMGALAQAWAYQSAQGGGGGGGGNGTVAGAAGGAAGKIIKDGITYVKDKVGNWVKDTFGGGRTADMPLGSGLPDGAFPAEAGDILGGLGVDAGLTDLTGSAAADVAGASQIGSDIAAGANYGAAASAPEGIGSGIGITPEAAGGLGAAAAIAVPTYLGLTTAPYRLNAKWWSDLGTQLTTGKTGNATYDKNTPAAEVQYNAKKSLYSMLLNQGGDTAVMGGAKGNKIPQGFLDMAKKYGMLNPDGTVNRNWNPGPDPFMTRAAQQAKMGVKGGSGGSRLL